MILCEFIFTEKVELRAVRFLKIKHVSQVIKLQNGKILQNLMENRIKG